MGILLRRRAGQSRRPCELIYALILILQQTLCHPLPRAAIRRMVGEEKEG